MEIPIEYYNSLLQIYCSMLKEARVDSRRRVTICRGAPSPTPSPRRRRVAICRGAPWPTPWPVCAVSWTGSLCSTTGGDRIVTRTEAWNS